MALRRSEELYGPQATAALGGRRSALDELAELRAQQDRNAQTLYTDELTETAQEKFDRESNPHRYAVKGGQYGAMGGPMGLAMGAAIGGTVGAGASFAKRMEREGGSPFNIQSLARAGTGAVGDLFNPVKLLEAHTPESMQAIGSNLTRYQQQQKAEGALTAQSDDMALQPSMPGYDADQEALKERKRFAFGQRFGT